MIQETFRSEMKNIIFMSSLPAVNLTSSSQEILKKIFYCQLQLLVVCIVQREINIIGVTDQPYQSYQWENKENRENKREMIRSNTLHNI